MALFHLLFEVEVELGCFKLLAYIRLGIILSASADCLGTPVFCW